MKIVTMRIIQHFTMIANIIVAFCIFQIALGQEDPEQAIRDFINQTNTEVNEYINPFVARIQDFARSFAEEDNQLQQEYADLSLELQNITAGLENGNPNVSNCLNAALEDAYAIYLDRTNELTAYYTISFSSLSEIMSDFSRLTEESRNLIRQTEQTIQYCERLANTEEANACYSAFLTSYYEVERDILNRFSEINLLGNEVFRIAQEEMQTFTDGNRQFVMESAEETRQELTSCIQNLELVSH